ncbi:ADP-ribose glycohydrolase OARD1-like isoform X1 [Pristis pectinata]|uniref:ADP-ribose glycohydrolase OARD1-like isoform X1 n=2 Tax=Pristis pectinata TaxID=685728 RepID=UPI00223D1FF5|nr:ADP-ribose glycohydrolase OARD1-like isoform X1 [Pristis pectinata]
MAPAGNSRVDDLTCSLHTKDGCKITSPNAVNLWGKNGGCFAIPDAGTLLVLCEGQTNGKKRGKMASSADKPLEGNLQSFKICYVQGDLFSCPEKDALAHCISEDCNMEAGIAVLFKRKYGCVEELQNQKKKIGDVAVLQKDQRCIYYLITKKLASDKPTYDALQNSLKAMRDHCLDNGILKISMPKIGCGLDNLEWDKVSAIIQEVFKSTDIIITVYSL